MYFDRRKRRRKKWTWLHWSSTVGSKTLRDTGVPEASQETCNVKDAHAHVESREEVHTMAVWKCSLVNAHTSHKILLLWDACNTLCSAHCLHYLDLTATLHEEVLCTL